MFRRDTDVRLALDSMVSGVPLTTIPHPKFAASLQLLRLADDTRIRYGL